MKESHLKSTMNHLLVKKWRGTQKGIITIQGQLIVEWLMCVHLIQKLVGNHSASHGSKMILLHLPKRKQDFLKQFGHLKKKGCTKIRWNGIMEVWHSKTKGTLYSSTSYLIKQQNGFHLLGNQSAMIYWHTNCEQLYIKRGKRTINTNNN